DLQNSAPKGRYNISLKIEYNYTSSTDTIVPYTEIDNSVQFEVRSVAYIPELKVNGYYESGALRNSGMFYAGDSFVKTRLRVRNNHTLDITTMSVEFPSLPTGISMESNTAVMPASETISNWEEYTFEFRTNVERTTMPGIHWTSVRLVYTHNDKTIIEDNVRVYFLVDYTPILQAVSLTPNTITQGTTSQAFEVSVSNIGNVKLTRLVVSLDIANYSSAYPYFGSGQYYYDGYGYKRVISPTATISNLDPGASTTVTIVLDMLKVLPPGEHRIPFFYMGYYEDKGDTGSTVGFKAISWSLHNTVYGFNPYAKLIVIDTKANLRAKQYTTLSLGSQVKDISFGVDLYNDEYVSYQDVMVKMEVGGNTPFLNRLNQNDREVYLESTFNLGSTTSTRIYFRIDLNPNALPGVYNVNLTVMGKNADTKAEISEIVPLEVTLRPRPPNVIITKVSYGEIKAGSNFKVQVTIQNRGGDSLRNTLVTISDYSSVNIPTTESTDPAYAAYAGSAISPFSPVIGAAVITELKPEESIVLNFTLACDANFVPGKAYQKAISISYYDSFGTSYSRNLPFAIQSKAVTQSAEKPFSATTLTGMIGFYAVLITLCWALVLVGIFIVKKLIGVRPLGKGKREPEEVSVVMPPQSVQPISRPINQMPPPMNPMPVQNQPIQNVPQPSQQLQMNPQMNTQMNAPQMAQPMPQQPIQQVIQQMPTQGQTQQTTQIPQGAQVAKPGKSRICQFCGKEMGKLPDGYKVCPHCKTPFS
ncbi:MAG: hypothetical protein QXT63_07095, partial [Thermoplasmata archaeon]